MYVQENAQIQLSHACLHMNGELLRDAFMPPAPRLFSHTTICTCAGSQ